MKIPFPKYEAEVVEEIESYLDMHYQTEIVQECEDEYGLKYLSARGFDPDRNGRPGTRQPNNYARPMFNVIWHQSFSGAAQSVTPCQCYRFDRSWACDEHPEVAWDTERRCWVRPGTAIWYELHPEDRPEGWESRSSQPTAYYTSPSVSQLGQLQREVPGPPQGMYDRLIEMFGRELPQPSLGYTVRPIDQAELLQYTYTPEPLDPNRDPNRNRPGYHYSLAQDRWVPDGVVRGQPVGYRDIAAEERLTAEWERQNGVPLADAVRAMRENISPFAPDVRRRLDALPDASLTLTGTFTLEITGDTTQASASTVRIEVERNGPTA